MIIDLFPTPIYIDEFDISSEERKYLYDLPMYRNADDDAWVSVTDLQLSPGFDSIKDKIMHHAKVYAYDEMCISKQYDLMCHGAWLNKNSPGDSTPIHHHSNSLISGVYYIDVDPSEQGAIQFHHDNGGPFGKFFTVLSYDEAHRRNTHTGTIECRNGMLLLFPSCLKHSVAKNLSNSCRYSLAFDFMISGIFDGMVNRMRYCAS